MLEHSAESTEKPIRVAQFIGHLKFGGAENQVVMLSNNLDSQLISRYVITMSEPAKGFRDHLESGVKYHTLSYRRRTAPLGFFRLYRYLRKNRIDILHCHMYHAAVIGVLAAALARVPVVLVSEHGQSLWKKARQHWIERNIIAPLTACRLAVSEDIRQLLIHREGIPSGSIKLIKNAVDTTVMPKDRSKKPVHLGTLGRLVYEKDYGVLIRSMAILRDRGYSLMLEIAGDGPERDHLDSLVADEKLSDRIKLSGFQDAGEFLERIDMFVMSSKSEGLPVSLLEAMANGLPIVATRVGAIPGVIEDGKEGMLCEARDPEGLANAIVSLVEDDSLRVSVACSARDKVEKDYGIQALAKNMACMYRDLLGKNTSTNN